MSFFSLRGEDRTCLPSPHHKSVRKLTAENEGHEKFLVAEILGLLLSDTRVELNERVLEINWHVSP